MELLIVYFPALRNDKNWMGDGASGRGEGGGGRGGGVPPELAGSGIEGRCSHNLQSDQNAYKSAVFSSS